jgi:hypothetical protein
LKPEGSEVEAGELDILFARRADSERRGRDQASTSETSDERRTQQVVVKAQVIALTTAGVLGIQR